MRVVVVGGGVIGLSCAYYAAQGGAEVVVLEAAGAGAGASRTNAGWIVPTMSDPVPSPQALRKGLRWLLRPDSPLQVGFSADPSYLSFLARMAMASRRSTFDAGLAATARLNEGTREAYADLARDLPGLQVNESGLLHAFTDEDAAVAQHAAVESLCRFDNPTPSLLSRDDVARREPGLSDQVVAGVWCPGERTVDPDQLVDALAARCTELGVRLVTGRSVVRIEPDGSRLRAVLTEPTGLAARSTASGARPERWAADRFVVAAGAASGQLLGLLGLRLPLQPGRGHGFDLETARLGSGAPLRHPVYLAGRKVAITPLLGRLRLAGTMEFGTSDRAPDPRRRAAILAAARELVPGVRGLPPSRTWSGSRPMTPDGLPAIGLASPGSNVVVATGHAMLGITLAPVTGQHVAALLDGSPPPPILAPFSPSRFGRSGAVAGRRPLQPVATHGGGLGG